METERWRSHSTAVTSHLASLCLNFLISEMGEQLQLIIKNYNGLPIVMCGCESWTIQKAEAKELMLFNFGVGEDS